MRTKHIITYTFLLNLLMIIQACGIPSLVQKKENQSVPVSYPMVGDTSNSASLPWYIFFEDQYLVALIDTALKNNQELNITLQEVKIAKNEIKARKGEYLPFLDVRANAGTEKTGEYTRNGAVEHNLPIADDREFPDPLPNLGFSGNVSWEIDIWGKLRNAKKSAALKYLSTIEGKNFMVTHLIGEIADSYFELIALDNQLDIVKKNIEIQHDALKIVKLQKEAARVTELAVRKFEAEVFKNQSHQFYIQQKITETENRINFLVGRFPQPVQRNWQTFNQLATDSVLTGVPSQLLVNRPDIRQAELNLKSSRLDIKVARANFYPQLSITAGVGFEAFNAAYLLNTPQSLLYSVVGDLVAPVVNRNAIKASYYNASAKQVQAAYEYEQTILNAYTEVANLVARIDNLKNSYSFKEKQVDALAQSIDISINLFKSARADYMEVLMTQRDALEARIELIETKKEQLHAVVVMYQALGGGWK